MLNAAGAIGAKAKAMYGKRITPQMYEELVRKRSVGEIASILKNETLYHETLKDIHEMTIHRGQLESLLRQDMYRRLDKMVRFVDTKHREYYMMTLKQVEIDQVLARIRVIASKDFDSALVEVPLYLDPYTKLNFGKLMNVKTYSELLEVVKGSEYEDILKQFLPKTGETFDYTACETTLQRHYVNYVFEVIDKSFKGKTRKTLKKMWATRVELDNITKIYRYKKFFHAPENTIREALIECEGSIPKAKLNEMLASNSAEDFMKTLSTSPYRINSDEKDYVYIEYFADSIQYHLARRHMHYETAAPLVFSAYHLLAEREVENLVNIIEGVRYKVPFEEIEKMLIY